MKASLILYLIFSCCLQFFLHVLGSTASTEVQSGATDISRGLTSGHQTYDTEERSDTTTITITKTIIITRYITITRGK